MQAVILIVSKPTKQQLARTRKAHPVEASEALGAVMAVIHVAATVEQPRIVVMQTRRCVVHVVVRLCLVVSIEDEGLPVMVVFKTILVTI